jgi:hypothetical protein
MDTLINLGPNFIFAEISKRLLHRLALLKITPTKILLQDSSSILVPQQLKTLFPASNILLELPASDSANQKYDLIVSNCQLLASADFKHSLFALKSRLNANGLLIFATLGLSSFFSYKQLLRTDVHFIDLHNLGDLMLNLHFKDPVMEMEILTLTYKKAATLINDLRESNLLANMELIPTLATPIDTNLEIIYGHAWRAHGYQNQFTDLDNNTYVCADSIEFMD